VQHELGCEKSWHGRAVGSFPLTMWLPRKYRPSELSPQEKPRQMGKEGYTIHISRGGCWPRSGLGDLSGDCAGKKCRDPYYSCFISYSSKDEDFAKRLYADLQINHVRCWFAPHDMRIGDEIRPRIDESIRMHDKLLLVLSESSLTSTWVKKEVETAFENEAQQQKLVLFPVRLDDTVMHTPQAWAADIRRMRHIGDFTHWKDHDEYQKVFARLVRDLQAQ
jgi:hypothetical protein